MSTIARAWSLVSLGFFLGVGGTLYFLRPEIQAAPPHRAIMFFLIGPSILMIAFIPPLIFEVIAGVRTWRNIQKRNAEQVGGGKRE